MTSLVNSGAGGAGPSTMGRAVPRESSQQSPFRSLTPAAPECSVQAVPSAQGAPGPLFQVLIPDLTYCVFGVNPSITSSITSSRKPSYMDLHPHFREADELSSLTISCLYPALDLLLEFSVCLSSLTVSSGE